MLFGGHQGDGMAALAGPAGAADAVHVILGHIGQIQIDHMGQLLDVDAPGGNVRGHQHPHLTALEAGQGPGAGSLALVAVDGGGRDALLLQPFRQSVGAVFGAGKHQHLLPILALDQVAEQVGLAPHVAGVLHLLDQGGRLVLRGGLQLHGLVQQSRGQLADLAGKRGRKQQVLALGRHQGQDPPDVADEAHVQHAVRLIEHQDFDPVELEGPLLLQVHQATRGGHQHIGAAAQAADLGIGADATKHHIAAQVEIAAIGHHTFGHLGGQLAGRRQHQGPHHAGAGGGTMAQALQQRQGETRGFTGTGLGRRHYIPALQHRWNALALDRRGGSVALGRHRLHQWLGEP